MTSTTPTKLVPIRRQSHRPIEEVDLASQPMVQSPSAARTGTVDDMRIQWNQVSDEAASQRSAAAQRDNTLGTGLGDKLRAAQGHSGSLKKQADEGRQAA